MSEALLRLYVAGTAPSSQRARDNLARLQQSVLPVGLGVQVIDVLAEPHLAEEAKILATPTLSYDHPSRPRRIIGDLSETRKVLDFLGFDERDADG